MMILKNILDNYFTLTIIENLCREIELKYKLNTKYEKITKNKYIIYIKKHEKNNYCEILELENNLWLMNITHFKKMLKVIDAIIKNYLEEV